MRGLTPAVIATELHRAALRRGSPAPEPLTCTQKWCLWLSSLLPSLSFLSWRFDDEDAYRGMP